VATDEPTNVRAEAARAIVWRRRGASAHAEELSAGSTKLEVRAAAVATFDALKMAFGVHAENSPNSGIAAVKKKGGYCGQLHAARAKLCFRLISWII
jgi:hypothetical protein